jgi:integrase
MLNELPIPNQATRRDNFEYLNLNSRVTPEIDPLQIPNVVTNISLPPRGGAPTSYAKERDAVFDEESLMPEIFIRLPEFTQPWHENVGMLLAARYEYAGWSREIYMNDFAILRDICGHKHPSEVFLQDLLVKVLKGKTQASRETYTARIKSLFNTMRMLGIIPLDHHPEEGLPKVKVARHTPRPISREQATMLMMTAREPMREWFMLGCLAGLRAIEMSRIRGDWLEQHNGNYFLRIFGKGDTDLLIPCHSKLVELIQSKNVLGRLYAVEPNYLSRLANLEMRRLGIATRSSGSESRLSLHSTRHFFATSVLAASGGNLITTQRLMRHASPVVTARYADLSNGEESRIMSALLSDIDWQSGQK